MTQFGRALRDLNIEIICANSSQAKGRVERVNRTLQDRLVSELRLADARTITEANTLLGKYRAEFNQKFSHPAREAELAWRPKVEAKQLERICSFKYEVAVFNDNTVRWNRNATRDHRCAARRNRSRCGLFRRTGRRP